MGQQSDAKHPLCELPDRQHHAAVITTHLLWCPPLAAKLRYGTTLANVDFLHGPAESLLTITNLLIGESPGSLLQHGFALSQQYVHT